MRNISNRLCGALLGTAIVALATPASADVVVTATLDKHKTITVIEVITKLKSTAIIVTRGFNNPTNAAEALAIANVVNENNTVDKSTHSSLGTPALNEEPVEWGVSLKALIQRSINDNSGLVGVNQDTGNMANQGNAISFAAIGAPGVATVGTTFTNSQAFVDQRNRNNSVTAREVAIDNNDRVDPSQDGGGAAVTAPVADWTPDKVAAIEGFDGGGSINRNTGVVQVNQNAGNMNNQNNALALAVGFSAVEALSEGALGQVNAGNTVDEYETIKVDRIANSGNGNTGIVQVNQSVGNMNQQGSVISFAALTASANINNNVANP